MRGASYCYLPILPARGGAFQAVGALSSVARSRLTPLFDVPTPVLNNGKTFDRYLSERAEGIHQCWEPGCSVYIDVHDIDPDLRTSGGRQPIEYLADRLRQHGCTPIPVTGTLADRGTDYVNAISALIAVQRNGVCLRIARDEIEEAELLRQSLGEMLDLLRCDPSEVDVVLDLRYVGRDSVERLRATTLDAIAVVDGVGVFRNVAIAGRHRVQDPLLLCNAHRGSIPSSVTLPVNRAQCCRWSGRASALCKVK